MLTTFAVGQRFVGAIHAAVNRGILRGGAGGGFDSIKRDHRDGILDERILFMLFRSISQIGFVGSSINKSAVSNLNPSFL